MKHTLFFTLVTLLVVGTQSWARPKSDVVILNNGDHITCEVKSLYAGTLECATDAMGTLKIEWAEIASVSSDYQFQVRYSDGSRLTGQINSTSEENKFNVLDGDGEYDVPWLEVAEMRPLQTTLKDALDIYVSAGYDYTKASESTQISLGLDIGYEQEKSRSAAKLRHTISDTRDESTSSTKLDLFRGFFDDPASRLFRYGSSSYESNDQLALDYRVSLGGGYGRYFIDDHRRQLATALGLQVNTERDLAGEQDESLEAAFKLQFAAWRFNTPELDLDLALNLYPSLTDSGRLRGDTDLKLRWELVNNLFWDITWWAVYDNRNTGDGNLDYGVSTGIGLDY